MTAGGKIIAVDFDGTICKNRWPQIGEARQEVIDELLRRQAKGDRLILWTCRVDERLREALDWCAAAGLTFDAVNGNLPEMAERFGNDCRKVYADEYWDDKARQVPATDELYRDFFGEILIHLDTGADAMRARKGPGILRRLFGRDGGCG